MNSVGLLWRTRVGEPAERISNENGRIPTPDAWNGSGSVIEEQFEHVIVAYD